VELLRTGRLYLVQVGKVQLNLRLLHIQTIKGVGTKLYELKITTKGYRLFMVNEENGKNYKVTTFSQIKDEVRELPKPNDLVQITGGKLLGSVGSVTVFRVKKLRKTNSGMKVILASSLNDLEVDVGDVRVREPSDIDPETLLSEQSKTEAGPAKRAFPGPAVTRGRLSSFLKPNTSAGSMSDERIMSSTEKIEHDRKEKEREAAKLHRQVEKAAKTTKKLTGELERQRAGIQANLDAGKTTTFDGRKQAWDTTSNATDGSEPTEPSSGHTPKRTPTSKSTSASSTGNTASKPSKTIGYGRSKVRRQTLTSKLKGESVQGEPTEDDIRTVDDADEPSSEDGGSVQTPSVVHSETDSDEDVTDPILQEALDERDAHNEAVEAASKAPTHHTPSGIPMNGDTIHPSYWEEVEKRQVAKKRRSRLKIHKPGGRK
jgi:hypothetical protein